MNGRFDQRMPAPGEQCDTVEADKGALSVACAHWPTNLSGARRCTLLRYVSEDGSPPPGLEVLDALLC